MAQDFKKLGDKAYRQKNYQEAIDYFNKYLETNPKDSAFIHNTIGFLYQKIAPFDNLEIQKKFFEKALELAPEYSSATRNLAIVNLRLGELDNYLKAVELFHKLLAKDPIPDDYCAYACLQIRLKNFNEGWKYYESRFEKKFGRTLYPEIQKPKWQGEDISDKILLVHYEQGFGDSICFFRYLELIKPLAKKIIFLVQDGLVNLFKINTNDIEIISEKTSLQNIDFDYHIPIMSILQVIKAQINDIPFQDGYIKANEEKTAKYKNEFFNNDFLKIGISWHGQVIGNKRRDIPLREFLALSRINNVKIYSFQKTVNPKEFENLPQNLEIINLGATFKDFSDTAAAMENIDIFVTSDNVLLNLAGAMGKKTFLLLNKHAEWRWFLDTKKTAWYSSVEIFKKESEEESWNSLMQKVVKNISQNEK